MHISEFKGKKVLIVGMAKTGVALAKLLAEQGALVTINDIRSEAELSSALNELKGLWKSSCSCRDESVSCSDESGSCRDESGSCRDESGSCSDESVSCRDESGSCSDDSGKERPSPARRSACYLCPLPPGERKKGTGPCSGFPREGTGPCSGFPRAGEAVQPLEYTGAECRGRPLCLPKGEGSSSVASIEAVQPLEYTGAECRGRPLCLPKGEGSSSVASIKSVFGSHPVETFLEQDLILVSPGVPIQQKAFDEARKRNIPISNDLELAFSLTSAPFLAISGTNGKTTTTSLLGDIFERAGKRIIVGGNIGAPLSPLVCERPETEFVIAEVSSFQLETIDRFRPMVGIMLNITPDHLDRYASWDEYVEAKAQLFVNQVAGDFALINATDAATPQLLSIMRDRPSFMRDRSIVEAASCRLFFRDRPSFMRDRSSFFDTSGTQAAPSTMRGEAGKLLFFSTSEKLAGGGSHSVASLDARSDNDTDSLPCPCPGLSDAPPQPDPVTLEEGRGGPLWPPADGVMIQGNDIVVRLNGREERICSIGQAKLRGEHNRENILAAALTAWLCHIDRSVIQKSIDEFGGLSHRIEFVAEINGVRFIDDSKGTNVDAVVRAIQSIDGRGGPLWPPADSKGTGTEAEWKRLPAACKARTGTEAAAAPKHMQRLRPNICTEAESLSPFVPLPLCPFVPYLRASAPLPLSYAGKSSPFTLHPSPFNNPLPLSYAGKSSPFTLHPSPFNNPLPLSYAGKSIWLILGGRDKGNEYLPLVPLVRDRVKGILAIGESREKVNQFFRDIVPVYCADSFKEAVYQGFSMASAGDSVLLSPACASFDMFTSYAHRGQVFKRFVEEIKAGNSGV